MTDNRVYRIATLANVHPIVVRQYDGRIRTASRKASRVRWAIAFITADDARRGRTWPKAALRGFAHWSWRLRRFSSDRGVAS